MFCLLKTKSILLLMFKLIVDGEIQLPICFFLFYLRKTPYLRVSSEMMAWSRTLESRQPNFISCLLARIITKHFTTHGIDEIVW